MALPVPLGAIIAQDTCSHSCPKVSSSHSSRLCFSMTDLEWGDTTRRSLIPRCCLLTFYLRSETPPKTQVAHSTPYRFSSLSFLAESLLAPGSHSRHTLQLSRRAGFERTSFASSPEVQALAVRKVVTLSWPALDHQPASGTPPEIYDFVAFCLRSFC